jgi:hypothetical protein
MKEIGFRRRQAKCQMGRSEDLEIRWSRGLREKVNEIAADLLVVIKEGSGIIRGPKWDTS